MAIFTLPFYSGTSGGILHTIALAEELGAGVYFQRLNGEYPDIDCGWFCGGGVFSKEPVISYSDDPFFSGGYINMLSYGMNIGVERRNAKRASVVFCSTEKLKLLLAKDGVKAVRTGFGLDLRFLFDRGAERKRYLAILYSNMPIKRYNESVKISESLYKKGVIDGVISFGTSAGYDKAIKPSCLISHYENATREELSDVFNECMCYIMPSVTEGLNLTPLESVLCGCPAVLCDGAIGEVYFDNENCFVSTLTGMEKKVCDVFDGFNDLSGLFRKKMEDVVVGYTWKNTAKEFKKWI